MLFHKKKNQQQERQENKNKKLFKVKTYRDTIMNYIDTLREKNIAIKKIEIKLNELNEIDIQIIGEEK